MPSFSKNEVVLVRYRMCMHRALLKPDALVKENQTPSIACVSGFNAAMNNPA
jgi:hypothetical protein